MNEHVADKLTLQNGLVYLRKHRRQIVVFVTCLLISGLLWLMIKLNRDYVHTITFRVNISGQQDGQHLIPLQNDTIVIELKAQGYQLLFNELSLARGLDIDFNKTLLRESHRPDILYIPAQSLLARIATLFPVSTELLNVKPDTLFFRVSDIEERRLPVIPDLSMDIQENYILIDTLVITPDSVTVKGDASIIRGLMAISTRPLDLKQVNKPFTYTLNLINPKPGLIDLDIREVKVSGRVVPAVNKTFILPVQISDTLISNVATPDPIELQCKIPVSELPGFNANTIRVSVVKLIREEGQIFGVLSAEAPSFVQQIRIAPERVRIEPLTE